MADRNFPYETDAAQSERLRRMQECVEVKPFPAPHPTSTEDREVLARLIPTKIWGAPQESVVRLVDAILAAGFRRVR